MSKFKIGDRVKCLDAGGSEGYVKRGEVYTVWALGTNITEEHVKLVGVNRLLANYRFELVPAEMEVGKKYKHNCNSAIAECVGMHSNMYVVYNKEDCRYERCIGKVGSSSHEWTEYNEPVIEQHRMGLRSPNSIRCNSEDRCSGIKGLNECILTVTTTDGVITNVELIK